VWISHLEESHGRSAFDGAVLDFGLFGEVVGRLDRRDHSLHREKRRQVGRVRRDDDESEEPPDAADDPRRPGSRSNLAPCDAMHMHSALIMP